MVDDVVYKAISEELYRVADEVDVVANES